MENEKDESKEVTFENVFSIPLSRMNNTDLEEGRRELTEITFYLTFLEKGNADGDERTEGFRPRCLEKR